MNVTGTGRPRLAFGCVRLGSVTGGRSWRGDVRLVQEAIDCGVTTFDTADSYGRGASECIVGRAIRGRRSSVEIATKAGYLFNERSLSGHTLRRATHQVGHRVRSSRSSRPASTSPGRAAYGAQSFSPTYLRQAVDASLRRLGTDYIDVFQLHGPRDADPATVDGVMAVVRDVVAAGKVRRFGIGAESVEAACDWSAAAAVDTLQVPFGMLDPQAGDTILPAADGRGIEVWVRGVFGGGLLSAGRDSALVREHPKRELIAEFDEVARQSGSSLFQLAIDFVRCEPGVSTILLGIHSSEHLASNRQLLAQPPVDATVIEQLRRISARWYANHEAV